MAFTVDPNSLIVEKITNKINEEINNKYPEPSEKPKELTFEEIEGIIYKIRLCEGDRDKIIDILVSLGLVKRQNKKLIIL